MSQHNQPSTERLYHDLLSDESFFIHYFLSEFVEPKELLGVWCLTNSKWRRDILHSEHLWARKFQQRFYTLYDLIQRWKVMEYYKPSQFQMLEVLSRELTRKNVHHSFQNNNESKWAQEMLLQDSGSLLKMELGTLRSKYEHVQLVSYMYCHFAFYSENYCGVRSEPKSKRMDTKNLSLNFIYFRYFTFLAFGIFSWPTISVKFKDLYMQLLYKIMSRFSCPLLLLYLETNLEQECQQLLTELGILPPKSLSDTNGHSKEHILKTILFNENYLSQLILRMELKAHDPYGEHQYATSLELPLRYPLGSIIQEMSSDLQMTIIQENQGSISSPLNKPSSYYQVRLLGTTTSNVITRIGESSKRYFLQRLKRIVSNLARKSQQLATATDTMIQNGIVEFGSNLLLCKHLDEFPSRLEISQLLDGSNDQESEILMYSNRVSFTGFEREYGKAWDKWERYGFHMKRSTRKQRYSQETFKSNESARDLKTCIERCTCRYLKLILLSEPFYQNLFDHGAKELGIEIDYDQCKLMFFGVALMMLPYLSEIVEFRLLECMSANTRMFSLIQEEHVIKARQQLNESMQKMSHHMGFLVHLKF
ncbi:hypothetical protein C9374_003323 [Naegleria lovaniensis]|uniref:Uncharacterized protein n=1 Tax=Naegleria lovaniensis TaxID=51637 RepID=A0AA88KK79_NAELO|nr:uncharacterized protein C9374_003323 [Naegleria lovaniensis]KAG2385508.1 hypothetical protein C9374_003323 [Naegleria lovaniensis]